MRGFYDAIYRSLVFVAPSLVLLPVIAAAAASAIAVVAGFAFFLKKVVNTLEF